MTVPLIAVGNIVKFRVWVIASNQASVNTFHFKCSSIAGTGGTLLEAATAFDALIEADYKTAISTQAEYRGVQAYVNQLPQPLPQSVIANAGIGTGGTTENATQVCGITSWFSDFTGQAFRGRTYWPFPAASADANPGQPSSGYLNNIDALSTLIEAFSSFGSGGNTSHVGIWLNQGKDKAGILRPGVPITAHFVPTKWATQRRRGIGYGRPNTSPI